MQKKLTFHSIIGLLTLTVEENALVGIAFGGSEGESSKDDLLLEARSQLERYFSGQLTRFELPVQPHVSDFERRVLTELQNVPYGQTTTYGSLAARIGAPHAARAVGGACHRNPVPIIIPCHRVIGANGSLVGFGGGLTVKSQLLRLEGVL